MEKAGQKLHALARLSNFMSVDQRKVIMNAFISSQFCYCPLLWMCYSRPVNTKINRIHERALRIVYDDNVSTFSYLYIIVIYKILRLKSIKLYKIYHLF